MKLFQLTSFVDQKDLDALSLELVNLNQVLKGSTIARVLDEALDNVETIDDELTYSDDTRTNGTFDGEVE